MSACAECGFDHEPGENTMCNADGGMAERIFSLESENARLRERLDVTERERRNSHDESCRRARMWREAARDRDELAKAIVRLRAELEERSCRRCGEELPDCCIECAVAEIDEACEREWRSSVASEPLAEEKT